MKMNTRRMLPALGALLGAATLTALAGCSGETATSAPAEAQASHETDEALTGSEALVAAKAPAAQIQDPVAATPAPGSSGQAATPSGVSSAGTPAATPAGSLVQDPVGPVGKIEVDTREHDFGQAVEGEVLTHTFKLKNVGEGPLMISQAKPTCGCTVGKIVVRGEGGGALDYKMNDPIPAGAEFEVEAQLNTRNKKNLAQSKINVFSNDPRGVIDLSLTAQVSPYFRIAPPQLDFGELSISDVQEKTFTVSTKGNEPFKLEIEERPVPDGMTVSMTPKDPDDEGRALSWDVKVQVGEGIREGRIGYPINLLSDQVVAGAPAQPDGSPTVYTTTAMVNALVKGLISYNPQYLSFGLVRPGQIQSRQLRIETNDPDFSFPPTQVRIEAPTGEESPFAEYFTYTVRPSTDNKALDVELTLNGMPADMNKPFQGKLVVETGHPAKPEVAVLFSGICRGAPPAGGGTISVQPGAAQQGGH